MSAASNNNEEEGSELSVVSNDVLTISIDNTNNIITPIADSSLLLSSNSNNEVVSSDSTSEGAAVNKRKKNEKNAKKKREEGEGEENWREWKPANDESIQFKELYGFQDGSWQADGDQSWKDVSWDEEREKVAKLVLQQEVEQFTAEERENYERYAASYWDKFYRKHQQNFFKQRNYLHLENPELLCTDHTMDLEKFYAELQELHPKQPLKRKDIVMQIPPGECAKIMEVGCGTGSSVFPIIETMRIVNPSRSVFYYPFDFAESAVSIVKSNPKYSENECRAFVCDITKDELLEEIRNEQIHIATLIFVLSAIDPEKMEISLRKIYDSLKPGGLLIFRDYGMYDLTQMRFVAKKRRKIEDNFYVRGDGTRTYFFSKEKVQELMERVGFEIKELKFDTREIKNRKRGLCMYRVWINGKFIKPQVNNNNNNNNNNDDIICNLDNNNNSGDATTQNNNEFINKGEV